MTDIEAAIAAIAREATADRLGRIEARLDSLEAAPPPPPDPAPDPPPPPPPPPEPPPEPPVEEPPPPPVDGPLPVGLARCGVAADEYDVPSRAVLSWAMCLPAGAPVAPVLTWHTEDGHLCTVQADVMTRHADGSPRWLLLATQVPAAIPAGERRMGVLDYGDGTVPAAQSYVAVELELARRNLAIAINGHRYDLADHIKTTHRSGPIVSGALIELAPDPTIPTLRLTVEAQSRADGSCLLDVAFRNDGARVGTWAGPGGTAVYEVAILAGDEVLYQTQITQALYTVWHKSLVLDQRGGDPFPVLDTAQLAAAAAILPYAVVPTDPNIESRRRTTMVTPLAPLATGDWATSTGAPGNRPDIGPFPDWDARVFTTDYAPWAQRYSRRQNDAGAGMPIHFFDLDHGIYLNRADAPNVWIDWATMNQGQKPRALPSVIQGFDRNVTPWRCEYAHQGRIGYVPFIVTGLVNYAMDAIAQGFAFATSASAKAVMQHPDLPAEARRAPTNPLCTASNEQVRGQAWMQFTIGNAAWLCPDWMPREREILNGIVSATVEWWQQQSPIWRVIQGEHHGRIMCPGNSYILIPPWQHDHMMNAIALWAKRGVPGVSDLIQDFFANWYLGRFKHMTPGIGVCGKVALRPQIADPLSPPPGVSAGAKTYNLDDTQPWLTTWAELEANTTPKVAGGALPWGEPGNYARLGMHSLAMLAHLEEFRAEATAVWDMLRSIGVPGFTTTTFSREATNAVAPPGRDLSFTAF